MWSELFESNPPGVADALRNRHFLLFGAGGLGSNAAVMLARAGAGKLTIVDFDEVVPSNLNRQYYFVDQIGIGKVTALRDNLLRVNPKISVDVRQMKVSQENVDEFLATDASVVLECFDAAESKAILVSSFSRYRPDLPIIAVSGLAGTGPIEELTVRRGPGNLLLVGDGKSGIDSGSGTLSTRVAAAAAMQAHEAILIAARTNRF